MTIEGELHATSDLMIDMIDRLRAAENHKRGMVPGTAEFARVAFEVEEMARMLMRWAEFQLRQANEALARGAATEPVPLSSVPTRRLDVVLAEWRRAEIRLSQAKPGSQASLEAGADTERLREEYRRLQDERHARRDA